MGPAQVLGAAGGYPLALLLTLGLEVPVYVATLGVISGWSVGPRLLIGVAVNLTHPVLWLAAGSRPGLAWLLALELAVVVVEGSAVRLALGRSYGWCLLAALAANALSFGVGLVLLPLALAGLGLAAVA